MKVLHISESFEGGIASAVANYVDLTPECEHFLLCNKRRGRLAGGILGKFSTVYDLTKGYFSAIKTVRKIVDKVNPDVIHCHSSFGGGFGRLAFFFKRCPALMIYSPHCYAFDRLDISLFSRGMFYIMEWILARRTDAVVACSKRETRLTKILRKKLKAIYVPNLASVTGGSSPSFDKRDDAVAMIGRLSPQKSPEWFAEVAEEISESDGEFVWIGDGEKKYKEGLRTAKVRLSGWVGPNEVSGILTKAKVYLHTAKWEGFPIAILDAHQCGAAIVVREASYLEGLGNVAKVGDVKSAAGEVEKLLRDRDAWEENRKRWMKVLSNNTSKTAKERLMRAYGVNS